MIALLMQLGVRAFTRSWLAGTVGACAWGIAREITQAEYRWIEAFGDGRRANMPWWGGFDPRVWQKLDPWLDWLLPCVLTITVALIARGKTAPQS